MASRRSLQQESVRFQLLRLLNDNPEQSTRQIAAEVGISNGSAYYCLNALVTKGFIKIGNFKASKHKGKYAYILTPKGFQEKARLTARFLNRKREEYEALTHEIALLEEELGREVQIGAQIKPKA